jgi:phage terminase large subunit-like protein
MGKRGPAPMPIADKVRRGTVYRWRDAERVEAELAHVTMDELVDASPRRSGRAAPRHFSEDFTARFCRHTKGRWYGRPFRLEPWQREFTRELLQTRYGRRVYRTALLGIPRKNGKSTLAAALALYMAGPEGEQAPDVVIAAGSRDQAAMVFNQARAFVDVSPELSAWYRTQRYVIDCPPTDGVIRRIAADGKLQHGLNPSAIVIDELHSFQTPRQEELYAAMVTSTGAREQPLTVAITTAGFDEQTILGGLYRRAMDLPDIEQRPGLTIGRDPDSGFLFWWFAAAPDADVDDEDAWMTANPASWVTVEELRRQRTSPTMDELSFRRLHLNQWTRGRDAWLPAGVWAGLRSDVEIPDGAEVYLGVDVGIADDSTAVAVAHRLEDGRVAIAARVWSAREDSMAHEHVAGGRVRLEPIEDHIRGLARRYSVQELVYDPRFFERSAQQLSDDGLMVAPFEQASKLMHDACHGFYRACRQGQITHDGDPVLAAHVDATAAEQTERGWRIRKLRSSQKIDACVAAVMAHSRAARSVGAPWAAAW